MPQSLLSSIIKNGHKLDDPLSRLLDRYLLERDQSPNRYWGIPAPIEDRVRPLGRLSPSSMGGCQRQAAFKFMGVRSKRKVNPENELVFDDGKWRHLRLGWMLKDMECVLGKDAFEVISIEQDVQFKPLYVSGSLDIIVKIHGLSYVIDFKGVNTSGWEYLFTNAEPKLEYVYQLLSYERSVGIKRGFLWCENKNTNRTLIFPVNWDKRRWNEVRRWAKETLDSMERGQLPPRHPECNNGRFLYGNCPYAWLCFGNKTEAQIERYAFRGFTAVDDLWREGQRRAESQDRR